MNQAINRSILDELIPKDVREKHLKEAKSDDADSNNFKIDINLGKTVENACNKRMKIEKKMKDKYTNDITQEITENILKAVFIPPSNNLLPVPQPLLDKKSQIETIIGPSQEHRNDPTLSSKESSNSYFNIEKGFFEHYYPLGDERTRKLEHHFHSIKELFVSNEERLLFFICQNLSYTSNHEYQQVSF